MNHKLNITLAAAGAVLLASCSKEDDWDGNQLAQRDTAICTDRAGNRVADEQCEHRTAGSAISPFLWYYLGRNSALPYYGEHVRGGSYTRTANATYFHAPVSTSMTRSAAISRGGLGSSARSSAHGLGGSHGFGGVGG